jgi:membrane protease YdiL (CAAX protease family)
MTQRPVAYLIFFLTLPLSMGLLIAPWIYEGIQALAPHHAIFADLARDRFERVATRCVQVIALLLVWPCLRHSGTLARVAPALRWSPARGRDFLRWALLGVASIAAVYAAGCSLGLYGFDPKHLGTWRLVTRPMEALVGALLVGTLEEYLFRGFIFGVLRTRFSTLGAAVISSSFFSIVHFMRPRTPEPLAEVSWTSGFELFPHMFALFKPATDWDFALTLFLMGMALCALTARHGHLYGVAGLHAGWVWVLQSGQHLLNQTPRHESFWFGWGDNVAQGALSVVVTAGFALYAWWTLRRFKDCRQPPVSDTTSP